MAHRIVSSVPLGDDSVALEVRQVNPLRQRASKWTDDVDTASATAGGAVSAAGPGSSVDAAGQAASRLALDANDSFELFRSDGAVMQDHRSQDHPDFSVATFVEQLVYQMLFPFSVPIIWLVRGWAALVNMRFVPSADQTYIFNFQLFLSGSVFACVGTYFATTYWDRKESAMTEFLTLEVIIVLVSAFFQRLPVATKWAYLPRPMYLALMKRRAVFADLLNDQIINGWADLSLNKCEVMNKELRQAQNRLGIDASTVFFSIPASKLYLLEAELCPLADAGVDVAALLASSSAAPSTGTGGSDKQAQTTLPAQAAATASDSSPWQPEGTQAAGTAGSAATASSAKGDAGRTARLSPEVPGAAPGGGSSRLSAHGDDGLAPMRPRRALSVPASGTSSARISGSELEYTESKSGSGRYTGGSSISTGSSGDSGAGADAEPAEAAQPRVAGGSGGVKGSASKQLSAGSSGGSGLLAPSASSSSNARVRISATVLAKMLLLRANRSAAPAAANTAVALLVLCFVAAFIPLLVRVAYGVPAGGRVAAERTQVAFSIIATFLHQLIYGQYLRVAATDFRRRADVLQRLGELCMNSNPRQARKLRKARAAAAGTGSAGPSGSGSSGTLAGAAAASGKGDAAGTVGAGVGGASGPGSQNQRAARKSMMLIRVRSERNTIAAAAKVVSAAASTTAASAVASARTRASLSVSKDVQLTAAAPTRTASTSGVSNGAAAPGLASLADDTASGTDIEAGENTANPLADVASSSSSSSSRRLRSAATPSPSPTSRAGTASGAGSGSKAAAPMLFARSGTPVIALAEPGNVVAFLITRRLLSVFGLRYFVRLQAYLSQAMLLALLIIVAILSLTLTEKSPNAMPATVGVASVALFLLTLLSFFLMSMLIWGARANRSCLEHAALLASRLFEVRQLAISARAAGNAAAADTFTETGLLIESAVNVVRADAELEPLKILSVPATFRLIQVIAISIVSALGAGFNLLWGLVLNKG